MLLKAFPNPLKSLLDLTFSQIFWLFDFFVSTLILAECNRKEVTFGFSWWQKWEFSKSIICD
jgi:hypothetical protein